MMTAPSSRFAPLFASIALVAIASMVRATTLAPVTPPVLWQPAEFRVTDGPAATNPFDPGEIRADAVFTSPGGHQLVVPAFWYQDFCRELVGGKEVLTPAGTPEWRMRFTPTEPGHFSLVLKIGKDPRPTGGAIARLEFDVSAQALPRRHGWVGVASNKRDLATSDGRILRLVGENVCWPHERGTFDYDDWLDAMQRCGQNFARLWMAPWWAGLEHGVGTLNRYRLDAAWELDHIFRAAEQRGIYLVLCFDHHGMYQVDNQNWGGSNNFWKVNPYSAANGGPCATPNDFFSDPRARELYEKRLRYLIGRYGCSPNLLAWQFMNEIDNVYGALRESDVIAWHREVGEWLHAHDPFQHLVTTSLTGGSDRPGLWQLAAMDFTMYHSYADAAPARHLAELGRSYVTRYGKPFLVGEFGTSAQNWNAAADPYCRGVRQGLWGGALGGSTGTAMSWWWEDIHSANAYPLWSSLHEILRQAGWDAGEWSAVEFAGGAAVPVNVGDADPQAAPFDAEVALLSNWRLLTSNELAVPSPLAASRGAEFLAAYLRPDKPDSPARPYRISAWFGDAARLVLHVDSVADDAELVVAVDSTEVGRTKLPDRDGLHSVNKEYDADFAWPIPPGKHVVTVTNVGKDWAYIAKVRFEHLRPASFAGGFTFQPEPIGLRQKDRAVVYVVSPWTVYPAGALVKTPPAVTGRRVGLRNWPNGRFEAKWYDPATGQTRGVTRGVGSGGVLEIPLPDFHDDLAGVIAGR